MHGMMLIVIVITPRLQRPYVNWGVTRMPSYAFGRKGGAVGFASD